VPVDPGRHVVPVGRSSRWIFVSKPLRPPFRDGTTVLVRSLVERLPPPLEITYFGDAVRTLRPGFDRVIEAPPMGYAPGLLDKTRILGALVNPRRLGMPMHFFFTPNRVTSSVVAMLRRLQPRTAMVQSVMSPVSAPEIVGYLRGLDAVVCASEHSRRALCAAGLRGDVVHCIPPGVELPPEASTRAADHLRLLYAGDLDGDVVQRIFAITALLRRPELKGWRLTVACRPKGAHHASAREALERGLVEEVATGRVELLSEVADMDQLLRRTSLQLFLAEHVHNKVDLPLVLLEGMARGVGLVSLDFEPVSEIFAQARAHDLDPGVAVPADDFDALPMALVELMTDPARIERVGAAARTLVRAAFDARTMARRYAELYASLG
jgi:glycosyltransferase involved in cell wall biosynthesis